MGDAIRIDQTTWRIEDGAVRFYLLCGKERAALIDSGMNEPDARKLAEELTPLPLILINTHGDPDHISGNGAFDEVLMSPAEKENYRTFNGPGKLVPLREGDVIDLGSRPLEIIDIPGHTPGSIAILDRNSRVLISGDTVQDGNIFMFGKFRNMDRYIKSLRHLQEFDGLYDTIWPMHGSFPVRPNQIGKLIEAALDVVEGRAHPTPVTVLEQEALLYKFEFVGFLCDPQR